MIHRFCWIHGAVWHLSKRRVVLPEDVSLAAPLKSDFLRLTPCQFSLCKRVARSRNHVGVRQAGLLHFQRVSSRFHGLFRPSFRRQPRRRLARESGSNPPAEIRETEREKGRTPTTTFLRRRRRSCSLWHFSSGRVTLVSFFARVSSSSCSFLLPLFAFLTLSARPTFLLPFLSRFFLPSFLLSSVSTSIQRIRSPLTRQNPQPSFHIQPGESDQSAAAENL